MPDRPSFPIPEDLTPDTYCLCIQMPNDPTWKAVISGLLWQPAEWFNWQRDDAKSGTVLAHYWRELFAQIDWSTMSCCCDSPPIQFRFNPVTNVYEKSTDGGVTWEPAPEYDPRIISTIQPNPNDLGVDTDKCAAADSLVVIITDSMINNIAADATISVILGIVATVILAFATGGTILFFSGLLNAVVSAIFGVGVAAWQAAFTSTVIDDFRCIIYNNISDDLTASPAQVDAMKDAINVKFTGIVALTLWNYLNTFGSAGVTNAIRAGRGDAGADCSGCTNECDLDNWVIYGSGGTITARTGGYVEIEAAYWPEEVGGYAAGITTNDANVCCYITNTTVVSGSRTGALYVKCAETIPAIGASWPHSGDPACDLYSCNSYMAVSNVPFTIRVFLSSEPCP